jgi:16S rRNA (uracil1498-N3)-methyltransferase
MMRTIRLHTEQPLEVGEVVELETAPARHLIRVLRRRLDDPVVLFNGDGCEYPGRIISIQSKDRCSVELDSVDEPDTESPLAIILIQAIARGERMDYAIQKAAELGVSVIQPVFSERCEVRLNEKRIATRMAHWRQVAISACEQCGRVQVPQMRPPVTLDRLELDTAVKLYLDPQASLTPGQLERPDPLRLGLVIGPEGGLSETEVAALDRAGYSGLRLGPRVLRTETAGPAAIAALQARFGDWQ